MCCYLDDADVCIVLSPCGLERFDNMLEALDHATRKEVLDILEDAEVEEAADRDDNVMWLMRGVSWNTFQSAGVRVVHNFLTEWDNLNHVLYMATGAAEEYGEDDIDVGYLTSNFDPTFAKRIVVWGVKEV